MRGSKGFLAAACLASLTGLALGQNVGPSTTRAPYLLPNPNLSAGAVVTTSLLSVGDSVSGYSMVGIPDGLGAFAETDSPTFTLLMNHELGGTIGSTRAHGSAGAFVSRWEINRQDLSVTSGRDHTPSASMVRTWDKTLAAYVPGTTSFNRLCSADLAEPAAYSYLDLGTSDRIYLNGEETRPPFSPDHGRAFAHIATGLHSGEAWELPRLGRVSYENIVASPLPQPMTVVMVLDDAAASTSPSGGNVPSEVCVYVGTKTDAGHPIERAGPTNGDLYGLKVFVENQVITEENNTYALGGPFNTFVGSARFELFRFGDVSGMTGRPGHLSEAARGGRGLEPPVSFWRRLLLPDHSQLHVQLSPVAPEV